MSDPVDAQELYYLCLCRRSHEPESPLTDEERADEDRWEAADRAYDLAREDAI